MHNKKHNAPAPYNRVRKASTLQRMRNTGIIAIVTIMTSAMNTAPSAAIMEKGPSDKPTKTTTKDAPIISIDMTGTQWQIAGVGVSGNSVNKKSAEGKGIIVAVIGDGVDNLHPDLQGVTVAGWDATKKRSFEEGLLHTYGSSGSNGTFQATIIAGSNDRKGIRGIAPASKIMPIVVEGKGVLSDEHVASGIEWAVKSGAKIITLSLGISEGSTSEKATKTCSVITAAREKGVLTFIPAVNDELISESTFKPAECEASITVTAVGENLSNRLNRKITVKPLFSAPSYDVVGGKGGGANIPYTVSASAIWSAAAGAGATAAIWSALPSLSAEELLNLIYKSATQIGDPETYGAGLVDIKAALEEQENGSGRRTVEQRRVEISKSSVPVIVDANRGGDGRSALTWLPPFNTQVEKYLVVISIWSSKEQKWLDSTTSYEGNTVRAVINGELNDDSYATVIAVTNSGDRKSLPVNNTWYNPAQPTYKLDPELAAVLKGSAIWTREGIEVQVEVNDASRPWNIIIIDPMSGEQIKKQNVSAGKTRHTIQIGQLDDMRNRPMLVAAGMGQNGVDININPQYGLKISVVPVGKTRAGVTGEVTCATNEVNNCDQRDLLEGTEIQVLDAKSKKILATAIVRSDRSFSALWKQISPKYDIIVVSGAEKSMRYSSSFFVR